MACLAVKRDVFQKTWNPKYTLHRHFDGVQAFTFQPVKLALVTASEDRSETLELGKKQLLLKRVSL